MLEHSLRTRSLQRRRVEGCITLYVMYMPMNCRADGSFPSQGTLASGPSEPNQEGKQVVQAGLYWRQTHLWQNKWPGHPP